MRASELLLIVRAQNQASGALRRVAGDLKGLSSMGGLRDRGQRLQMARQSLNLQRQIAANELQSIERGRRSVAAEKAKASQILTASRAQIAASSVSNAALKNEAAQLAKNAEISRRTRSLSRVPAIRADQVKMIKAAQIQLRALIAEEEILAEAGAAAGAISKQALALKELEMREVDAANRSAVLRNRIANYGDALAHNSAQIEENNKAMRRAPWEKVAAGGRIMQHTARIMEYGGLVLGGTLAVLANNASKFGTSVTLAATQTRGIGQSFKQTAVNSESLQASIRGLMTQFPASADEMSKAAYDIYSSLNISLPAGVKLLKVFNQAAVAGQTSLDEVAQAGITVMNDFRIRPQQMAKGFQTMFAAVRFGRMTFKEFVAMMPQLSPAFSAAGYGLREMSQAAAFMTRVMPNTRMAATSLARITEMFSRKDFIAGTKAAGVQITDFHNRLLPLPTIIDRLAKGFPEIGKAIKSGRGDVALQNFFKTVTALGSGKEGTAGTIQGRRAMIFLVTQSKLAHTVYGQVAKDQTEFTNSLKAMEQTTGVKWGTFINQLKALALAIGANVIPALTGMVGPLQDVIKWWENLDESTKSFVARFATYTAAFLLVGGAIVWLTGTFINLFGTIGKFAGLGGAMTATLVAVAVAVTALSGNLHGLSSILDTITNFALGSFTGFATTMGIAAVAAVKLAGALKGVAAAQALGGETAAVGGLAGLLGRGRSVRAGATLAREAMASKGAIAGLAASAALIPGSFVAAGAAIAAAGAGLLIWHMHMERIRRDAEAIKAAMQIGAGPRLAFDMFQQLPAGVANVVKARIAVRQYTAQIADYRKQAAGATGARRQDFLDQATLATLALADAQQTLQESNAIVNRQFNAYTQGLIRFNAIAGKAKSIQQAIRDEQIRSGSIRDHRIDNLRAQYRGLMAEAKTSAVGIERAFTGVVSRLSRMQLIPKVSPTAMRDMFNISKQAGRMLTIPEMKAIIRAEVDPSARAKIPADIRSIFSKVKTQRIKVEAEKATATKDFAKLSRSLKVKPVELKAILHPLGTAAQREHKKAATIFGKTITQKVDIKPSQNPAAIGANIAHGIQQGLNSVDMTATVTQHVNKIVETYNKVGKGHSPYMLFAEKVGKPIIQGISLGMLQSLGGLEQVATITANLLSGKILSGFEESKKKKLTAGLITKDLQSQVADMTKFNNAIARLTRRGAPREMVDQLAALGPEMAKQIAIIANMTDKEWKKYLRAWNRQQGQIKRSMRATAADLKAAAKQMKDAMFQTLSSTYKGFQDANMGSFVSSIFSGFDSQIGDGFKQAMDDYNSQVADFQGQIKDLNQQIADAQKEGQQRLIDAINARRDELQQAMGALFSGDWMQGTVVQTKIEWGKKLGFDDLQKDLQSQVDKFALWRKQLTEIAAKVPPELAAQLEALGPEAVDKIQVLNSGSKEQIAAYVALWQQGQSQIMAVANKTTVDTSDITARIGDIVKQIDELTKKLGALQMPHELTGQEIIDNIMKQAAAWDEYGGLLQTLLDKGIPAELIQQLASMGPEALPYLRALNNISDTQLAELQKTFQKGTEAITTTTIAQMNTQLKLWFQYGRDIGLNIIAGIDSMSDKLAKWFRNMIEAMIKGLRPPAPPPVTNTGNEDTTGAVLIGGNTGGVSLRQFDQPNTVVNMTVNATQNESLDTTLNRAAFRIKNTVPG